MELYIWGIQVAIAIVVLIFIYQKREEDESYLGLKLFGYSFLASFTFRLQNFPIPLGFIIYLLFFHPKVNRVAKRRAALLGLVFFFVGAVYVYPAVEKYSFERPQEIALGSSNVHQLSFSEEWNKLQTRLNIVEDARLIYINIAFNPDGKLNNINGKFIGMKDYEFIRYSIEYDPITDKSKILRQKSTQNVPDYHDLVTMTRLFNVVDRVKEKNLLPNTMDDYLMHAEGRMDIGKMTYEKVYFIDNNGNVKMDEYENLPIVDLPLMMVENKIYYYNP